MPFCVLVLGPFLSDFEEGFRLGSFVQEVRWIEGHRFRVEGLGTLMGTSHSD